MEENSLCFGVKSKFGIVQVVKIAFDDLGKPGYDYQFAFKTISEGNGNGSFDLVLIKDGEELESIEMDGWKLHELHVGYNWGETYFMAEATDCLGETHRITFADGKGSMSDWQPSYQSLLGIGLQEMKRVTGTYSTHSIYNLCEDKIIDRYLYPTTLWNYYYNLQRISEYFEKAEKIRARLHDTPDDKDCKAYDTVLKPKLIDIMEKLSQVKISPDQLNYK